MQHSNPATMPNVAITLKGGTPFRWQSYRIPSQLLKIELPLLSAPDACSQDLN
jgi:hypothetical protein